MFEEEEPGKPKNWGCTVAVITLITFLNMTIIVICRVLLDSRDENNQPWLEGSIRENLTLFLGMFAMSFCFYCCCCFCCGGSLCRWIANWHYKCFDPSNLWSDTIKTTVKASTTRNRQEDPFFVFNVTNDGDCMMVGVSDNSKPKPPAYANEAFKNSSVGISSENQPILTQICHNQLKNILKSNKESTNPTASKQQHRRRKSL